MEKKRKMNIILGDETKNKYNTWRRNENEHNTRKRNTIRGEETKNEPNTWRRNG